MMPTFNTPTPTILLTLLLACELAITSPVIAYRDMHGTIYSPESYDDIEDNIAPSANIADGTITLSSSSESKQVEQLYERCVLILGEDCGNEIFDVIFRSDTAIMSGKDMEVVSQNCCGKLLNMGRRCHDQLVDAIVKTPEFSTKSSATVPRGSQVWDLCSLSPY